MVKMLVLYYSAYGYMEQMAKAAAEGAREGGAEVTLKRVPELVPEEVAKASHYKIDQEVPIATPGELADYDAIIIGTATRYGMMASQMKNFLDQTGGLWAKGALINKVGSVMVSTATQHGGAELALISTQWQMQHHGMIIVPLSYAYREQMGNDVVRGGRLRHDNHRRWRRLAPAFRTGTGWRPFPGQAGCGNYRETAWLTKLGSCEAAT